MSDTMSDTEIRIIWHTSKQDQHQLKILSECTLKPVEKIKEIVGYKGKEKKPYMQRCYTYNASEIQADILAGMTTSKLVDKYKVSHTVVTRHRNELRRQGKEVPDLRCKYSNADINKALTMREQGCSYSEIKLATGIEHTTVANYYKKTPHVTGNNVESV